jgi:hypothetical protein
VVRGELRGLSLAGPSGQLLAAQYREDITAGRLLLLRVLGQFEVCAEKLAAVLFPMPLYRLSCNVEGFPRGFSRSDHGGEFIAVPPAPDGC